MVKFRHFLMSVGATANGPATAKFTTAITTAVVGPVCYTVPASFTPTGAMTLELKVVIGSLSDRITIGMVALSGVSE